MSKHKLFALDDSRSMVNSSMEEIVGTTPRNTGRHPALNGSSEQDKTRCNKTTDVCPRERTENSKPDSAAEAEDCDSDSMDVPGFFCHSNQKLPYTRQEDEVIVKYVLKGENIFKVSSILLWKQLEAKKENPKRTYQSLKNRFLRNIKPYMFSTYRHLIKNKETTEKILSKFPELKTKVGRQQTLSRLKLPEINPQSKPPAEDGVSSTSTRESQMNDDETFSPLKPNSTVEPNPVVPPKPTHSKKLIQTESVSLGSYFFKPVNHQRVVEANKNGIFVHVDLKSNTRFETSFSSTTPGIYEKFKRIKGNNKLVFCPTCGRYNRPKHASVTKSSEEADVFVPSSIEKPEPSSENFKRRHVTSKLSITQTSSHRRLSPTPESSVHIPHSPDLLSSMSGGDEKNREVTQVPKMSNSCSSEMNKDNSFPVAQSSNNLRLEKCASGRSNETIRRATQKAKGVSNSKSNKKGDSITAKRPRDNDTDFDSICEDAMANFRKLIDYEEEKQLVRKCLNKNFKSIDLEGGSQMNLDSYFLESSPSDKETTPPLVIDSDANPENSEEEEQSSRATGAQVSQNLQKKCHKRKKKS